MKKKNKVKDIDIDMEFEKQEKKRKIKLIVLMIFIGIIGIFFLSTYLRWNEDINDKYRIIYYGQENIKIDDLKDFYGGNVSLDISDDEAILMYCSKNYGASCITADYNNWIENIFRNPIIIINVVIIIELLLLYTLIKDIFMKDYKRLIMGLIILIYGLGLSFMQMYNVAEYYIFTNNKYDTVATIYKKVITGNKNEFKPIVKYEIDGKEYIEYLDTNIKGSIEDNVGQEINIHYYKKDKNTIVGKKFVLWRIAPFILGIIIIIISIKYFPKFRRLADMQHKPEKEEKEEVKK